MLMYRVELGPKSLKMCLRKKWMVPNPGWCAGLLIATTYVEVVSQSVFRHCPAIMMSLFSFHLEMSTDVIYTAAANFSKGSCSKFARTLSDDHHTLWYSKRHNGLRYFRNEHGGGSNIFGGIVIEGHLRKKACFYQGQKLGGANGNRDTPSSPGHAVILVNLR